MKLFDTHAHVNFSAFKDELGKEFALFENVEMFDQALSAIWDKVKNANIYIEDNKPWELAKTDGEKFNHAMRHLAGELYVIASLLGPFMPETAEKIKKALETKTAEPLFQRIKV